MHIALRFAYDGNTFQNGYARQPEGHTVEDFLIDAVRKEGFVEGSWETGSRTDKGVSAAENVAKCLVDRAHLQGLAPALQANLPTGLWVTGVAPVDADWNPRHGALRTYEYVIQSKGEQLAPMEAACAQFVGEYDMSAFARVESHRDPQRTITQCTIEQRGDAWLFTVASPGFLWNQVRRMVDAVLAVGREDCSVADITDSLRSGTPHPKFNLVAPQGLLLKSVRYTPELPWSEEAGTLDRRRLESVWQKSQVESRLLGLLNESS